MYHFRSVSNTPGNCLRATRIMSRTEGAIHLASVNQLHDEHRIVFTEEDHRYTVDGKVVDMSVTRLLKKVFGDSDFEKEKTIEKNFEKWRNDTSSRYYSFFRGDDEQTKKDILELWDSAAPKGTRMHAWIELLLNGVKQDAYNHETELFLAWLDTSIAKSIEWFRTELSLWWEQDGIPVCCGQIDAVGLMTLPSGKKAMCIFDWKRIDKHKEISYHTRAYGYAKTPSTITHVPNNTYTHIGLQISAYAVMLKQRWDIDVDLMYVLRMYEGMDEAELIQMHDFRYEAYEMLSSIRVEI